MPGSPAAKAGLIPGMVITHVNGQSLAGLPLLEMQKSLSAVGPRKLTIVGKGEVAVD